MSEIPGASAAPDLGAGRDAPVELQCVPVSASRHALHTHGNVKRILVPGHVRVQLASRVELDGRCVERAVLATSKHPHLVGLQARRLLVHDTAQRVLPQHTLPPPATWNTKLGAVTAASTLLCRGGRTAAACTRMATRTDSSRRGGERCINPSGMGGVRRHPAASGTGPGRATGYRRRAALRAPPPRSGGWLSRAAVHGSMAGVRPGGGRGTVVTFGIQFSISMGLPSLPEIIAVTSRARPPCLRAWCWASHPGAAWRSQQQMELGLTLTTTTLTPLTSAATATTAAGS